MDIGKIADRLAIREVVETYTDACTRRRWDDLGRTFHEDGVWSVAAPFNLEVTGRDEIQRFISTNISKAEFAVQMVHNVVVDLDGDRATARAIIHEMARHDMPEHRDGMFMLGLYTDELSRRDNRWAFVRRSFQPFYIDNAWLPGMAMDTGSAAAI